MSTNIQKRRPRATSLQRIQYVYPLVPILSQLSSIFPRTDKGHHLTEPFTVQTYVLIFFISRAFCLHVTRQTCGVRVL